MTLTMAQLDRIRCDTVPPASSVMFRVVRDAVGYFSNQCLPIPPITSERT